MNPFIHTTHDQSRPVAGRYFKSAHYNHQNYWLGYCSKARLIVQRNESRPCAGHKVPAAKGFYTVLFLQVTPGTSSPK